MTLIELLVALVVLAVFVTIGIPSFNSIFERHRVTGAAQALYGDLQFARAEAIKRNQDIYVKFNNGTDWCYGIEDTSAASCSCATGTGCTVEGRQHIVTSDRFPGVSLSHNVGGNVVTFDPVRGTLAPNGTIKMDGGGGKDVGVTMSLLGRVRLCSDSGFAGYQSCP
ncbi:GspH/FimT family pseudopilin [Marinobacterium aestuariivivens]|uniref:Type II secretion system protein H n=1 Tax=Marinobacterium aestuariivivens TaxID=1698799 RepID=A0ABW2A180_9GAMM